MSTYNDLETMLPQRPQVPVKRPLALIWLSFSLVVLAATGCNSLVWDPTERVGSSKGHITDKDRDRRGNHHALS